MSRRLHDLTGRKFGRWTVLALWPERYRCGHALWLCRCDCGEECIVLGNNLRIGSSTRCKRCRNTKHGHARRGHVTRVYMRWRAMMARCFNPNVKSYGNYGGRNDGPITVCEPWRIFQNYLADTGEAPSPGLTVGRINNDGHYEPTNWHWETYTEQARNRRSPKRKRRAKLTEIQAFAASLARAASAPGGAEAAP
jgi:hypothetical protein